MNVKEFKKRWLRGYVRPELFYLPVEDNYDFKPMIIKVEVSGVNNKCDISIYPTINKSPHCSYYYVENNESAGTYVTHTYSGFNTSVLPNYCLYNMKTPDNIPVNKTNFPDFFKNFLEEDILFECAMPFLNINWGDGTTSEFSEEEICKSYTMNIDGIECTGYYFSFSTTTVPIREKLTHIYESDGIYEVTISGNLPHISFYMLSPTHTNNCVLTEVVQWGNLHLRSTDELASIFISTERGHIKIPPLDNSFNKVLTAANMFQHLDITFNDLGGDDCLKFFPNLINATHMFYGTKITYIPEYFTINNKKLINIVAMFSNCAISHIGDYAFANLPELRDISYMFDFYNCYYYEDFDLKTCIVGNSIFENDVNLTSVDNVFANYYFNTGDEKKLVYIKSVGSNIFKGCKSIVTAYGCFYMNLLLESVGENLFEGCENLYSASYLFAYLPLLRNIGANLFKGCKNLREVNGMFYNSFQVQIPDNLFYDLKFNYDFKDNSMDFNGFTYGWITFVKNTDADGNVYEHCWNEASLQYLSVIAPEKYNEIISKGYDGFPSIRIGKNMFNSTFLNSLILNNCHINGINGETNFAGACIGYEETVHQHCFYTHQGTGQTIPADFVVKSVNRKRIASEGEVPDFWNYDDKLLGFRWADDTNHDNLYLFGYTNQHGQDIENYTYSIKNSDNTYTTYQTGYSCTYIYDINKGKWDNAGSIPNPKLYMRDMNYWYRRDCHYLTYYASTYCPNGYMNNDIDFIWVDE